MIQGKIKQSYLTTACLFCQQDVYCMLLKRKHIPRLENLKGNINDFQGKIK